MFFFISYILVVAFVLLLAISFLVHAVYLIPFVPSKTKVVTKMIHAANLRPNQTVIDLGCGDGRLLFAAEKSVKNITSIGFEIAPLVYLAAQLRKLLQRSKAKIHFKSLFHADLRNANVIFCYLFPNVMAELAAKIHTECKPGTRIISNTFTIPNLELVKTYPRDTSAGTPSIHVYTV